MALSTLCAHYEHSIMNFSRSRCSLVLYYKTQGELWTFREALWRQIIPSVLHRYIASWYCTFLKPNFALQIPAKIHYLLVLLHKQTRPNCHAVKRDSPWTTQHTMTTTGRFGWTTMVIALQTNIFNLALRTRQQCNVLLPRVPKTRNSLSEVSMYRTARTVSTGSTSHTWGRRRYRNEKVNRII